MRNRIVKRLMGMVAVFVGLLAPTVVSSDGATTTRIPDTGVTASYSDKSKISSPSKGKAFYGQDGQFRINKPSYVNNRDDTITDRVTGLMWEKSMGEKMTLKKATQKANQSNLGGYNDWRVPTITELYSLIQFTGKHGRNSTKLFIDKRYFDQPLGQRSKGERTIDAQTWSSTVAVGKVMNKSGAIFGANFVDGRIKAYPKTDPRTRRAKRMYFRLVRGNTNYGKNNLVSYKNGTVADKATGLTWARGDCKKGMDWKSALAYCDGLQLGG